MKVLLISDLHFDEKPVNLYRFKLFDEVNNLIKNNPIDKVIILGDVLDKKDGHSNFLINTVTDGLNSWSDKVNQIILLYGNHDNLTANTPALYFTRHIPRFRYVNQVTFLDLPNEPQFLFLPHSRNEKEDWKDLDFTNQIVFAHTSVKGAVYESGQTAMEGTDPHIFDSAKLAFSGDIHSPTQIENLIYVGCPYRIRFNDTFQGGGIILDTEGPNWKRVKFDFPNRWTIDVNCDMELTTQLEIKGAMPGDQLKIRFQITKDNMSDWQEQKENMLSMMKNDGFEVCSFEIIKEIYEPTKCNTTNKFAGFDEFCKKQKVTPELMKIGKEILNAVNQA